MADKASVSRDSIANLLLKYIREKHFNNYGGEMDIDTHLLEKGIVDSLSMMAFILFLEQRFELDFMQIDISRNDFQSIRILTDFVVHTLAMTAETAGAGSSGTHLG